MTQTPAGLTPFARRWIVVGAILMLLGVILGAFGSHLLAARLEPKQLASYQTGVLYQLLHALGLVLVGLVGQVSVPTRWLRASAALMAFGIACFSGSIYLMTAGAPRTLGMVAPIGGLSFMIAWASLALHVRTLSRVSGRGSTESG
ncbi:MAG TPA: DUF423 domain-containing protein [Steroidobacteraceae bacterium]